MSKWRTMSRHHIGRTLLISSSVAAASLSLEAAPAAHAVVNGSSIVSTIVPYDYDAGVSTIRYGAGAVYEVHHSSDTSTTDMITVVRRVIGQPPVTVAGGGMSRANGVPATSAQVDPLFSLWVQPDGTLYFVEPDRHLVRKVDTAGIITTVAGNGTTTLTADGAQAVNAGLDPVSVAVDGQGNLLIGEAQVTTNGLDRVRRVDTNGVLTTFVVLPQDPDAVGSYSSDFPVRLGLDAFGNTYVLRLVPGIGGLYHIAKITPAGVVTRIGDDNLDVQDITLLADGTIFGYASHMLAGTVTRISPTGAQTVLDSYPYVSVPPPADGPLSQSNLQATAITSDPAGTLYFVGNNHLLKVTNSSPLPAAYTLQPTRILDTRPGSEQTGYTGLKPTAGQTVSLQVAGRGGVPSNGAAAVTMNVTITDSDASGFVTVWPSGIPQPLASTLNAEGAGNTVANLVTVPVGVDGKVNLFTQAGGHLLADVAGWMPTGAYVPKTPTRIMDTRPGATQLGYTGVKPAAGATIDLQISGNGGVPTTGVAAVTLNVTATEATAPGFVTVWPSAQTRPLASSLNLDAVGATAPNQVTVPIGSNGKISIFTQSGTHVIVDLVGYYTISTGFSPLTPARLMDTRPGPTQLGYSGNKPTAGQTVSVAVTGHGGVPTAGVGSVLLNVTATEATAPGYVSAWPGKTTQPNASILNLTYTGQTRPNAVLVPVGSDGTVNLFTQSGTHLIVDVNGWFPST